MNASFAGGPWDGRTVDLPVPHGGLPGRVTVETCGDTWDTTNSWDVPTQTTTYHLVPGTTTYQETR